MLTQEELKEVLNYDKDTGIFTWKIKPNCSKNIGDIAGTYDSDGYVAITVKRKSYRSHRLAWLYEYGNFPILDLDHINGVRDDNRILNLREATRKQNSENQRMKHKNNTTGYLGVSFHKRDKKFTASIGFNNKLIHLGYFFDAKTAHEAYLKAKRELHEFCTI